MKRPLPVLLRRREIWLPTLPGALLLLVAIALLVVVLARSANGFLAPQQPARGPDGLGARTLIVEGWLEEAELAQAVALYRRGRYQRVLATGGPIEHWADCIAWQNFAERGAAYLRSHGLAHDAVVAVPAPATLRDRTWLSAVKVREWAQRSGVALDAVDLFSGGMHARRSRLLFRLALGDAVEVGVIAAVSQDFDAERWWHSSAGTRSTLGEALALLWTVCCFRAPGPEDGAG